MLTLIILLSAAIVLSLMGKKGQKVEYDADELDFAGHMPDAATLRRAEEVLRRRKKITIIATVAVLCVAILIDWNFGGSPFATGGASRPGQGHGQSRAPGLATFPGWQSGSVEIPPQGFSGHMLMRFENGEASAGGFMIVAPGEKRRFGWRLVGGDAPSCILRIEFAGSETQEVGWWSGFSFLKQEFGEGEHEASFTAWCPAGRHDVDFQFATMATSRDDHPVARPSWQPASGADIRHH